VASGVLVDAVANGRPVVATVFPHAVALLASEPGIVEKVSSWVGRRLNCVPGSSHPIDGAVDTLLAGEGVRRDYGHLVVGWCAP
jgi:hypothetical protein